MVKKAKVDDEIRIRILLALLQKGTLVPNLEEIRRLTGYHKNTIRKSLEFLKGEGALLDYVPYVDPKVFGFNLLPINILQFDMSEEEGLESWVKSVEADPNVFFRSNLMGSGKWNMLSMSFYRDMESYNEGVKRKYYSKTPEVYKLTKDVQSFYASQPFFKKVPRGKAIVDSIMAEKGYRGLKHETGKGAGGWMKPLSRRESK